MEELHIYPREFEDTDMLAICLVGIIIILPFIMAGWIIGKAVEWVTEC